MNALVFGGSGAIGGRHCSKAHGERNSRADDVSSDGRG